MPISIPGERVARVIDAVVAERGAPDVLVSDNGPEFTGRTLDQWASQNSVRLYFIQPGKPMQNGFIESFNGTFRAECLDASWFVDLTRARAVIAAWRQEYNERRPHSSIGRMPPAVFAKRAEASVCIEVGQ